MTTLSLAIVMQASIMGVGTDTYSAAHKVTTRTGRPMVVMVGADWCAACVQMKQSVIPKIKEHGALEKVAFAMVNVDRQQQLGKELTRGGPIPQLLMYRKTSDGWKLRRLVGGQSVDTVKSFIDQGVKLDKAAKKARQTSSHSHS